MEVDLRLGLRDVPGMLVKAIEPISRYGGNIQSILHTRGARDVVEVRIVFKIADEMSLDFIKKEFRKQKIRVMELTVEGRRYYSKKNLSFILIGHVIDTDVRNTIDRINEVGVVSDVDVVMPDPGEKSSVMFTVDVDEHRIRSLNERVVEICAEKKFLLIKSI